jgi:cytochrome c oxidase subunit 2
LIAIPRAAIAACCAALFACASAHEEAVPATLDRTKVPHQTVEMTARKFEFIPAEVHVKRGTLVTLEVQSTQGTHGIAIDRFAIDEELAEGVKRTIVFYAAEPGEIPFRCSHLCGSGHFSMKGRFIVD